VNTLEKVLHAARFAAQKHTGQTRKGIGAEPYINHPIEVAHLIASVGHIYDEDILAAAILHDTIEDTDTTAEEITQLFGDTVCGYVLELTDDKSLPKARRKELQVEHAPHLSYGAKIVKIADKISNIRDVVDNPAMDWDLQRKKEYVEWGVAVVNGLRGINEPLDRHFDELVEHARRRLSH
jgi:GTP diphosphokinase / guanosine-3',5'-bis(diphosphate) 3'-diphosphatase